MLQASRRSSSWVISSPSATASPHMSWKEAKTRPLKCALSATVSTSAASSATMYVFDCFDCVACASRPTPSLTRYIPSSRSTISGAAWAASAGVQLLLRST